MKYPAHLEKIVTFFKRLPGVGTRTAERYAFSLLDWEENQLAHFATLLAETPLKITHCDECGALQEEQCPFCTSDMRRHDQLCLVASPKEIFSIEKTGQYGGLYHVLDALLSPLDEVSLSDRVIDRIKERMKKLNTTELIIALDSSLEGDTTAHYLKEALQESGVKIFRLAFGLSVGSPLDHADPGTLSCALLNRSLF